MSDTAENIVANLDILEAAIKANILATVHLTNSTMPSVQLSGTQLLNDADVLKAMASGQTSGHPAFMVALNDGETLSASQAAAIDPLLYPNILTGSLVVLDDALHVSQYALSLENLMAGPLLGSILLTDTGFIRVGFPIAGWPTCSR